MGGNNNDYDPILRNNSIYKETPQENPAYEEPCDIAHKSRVCFIYVF